MVIIQSNHIIGTLLHLFVSNVTVILRHQRYLLPHRALAHTHIQLVGLEEGGRIQVVFGVLFHELLERR